jgi:hypothetical protein
LYPWFFLLLNGGDLDDNKKSSLKIKGPKGLLNSLGAYCMGIFWKNHLIRHSKRLEVKL